MFQAYVITCLDSGKRYVGITRRTLLERWNGHVYYARKGKSSNALYSSIRKYGSARFIIEPILSAFSWSDLCALEIILIRQWGTLAPHGYNLSSGGEGRGAGFKPSPESVERSASKHRGKPCHPNTRKVSSETHKGKPKSAETRRRMASSKRVTSRSQETKDKISASWAAKRSAGMFKTTTPYAHSRKAASAMIAKIPYPLASWIAKAYKPDVLSEQAKRVPAEGRLQTRAGPHEPLCSQTGCLIQAHPAHGRP